MYQSSELDFQLYERLSFRKLFWLLSTEPKPSNCGKPNKKREIADAARLSNPALSESRRPSRDMLDLKPAAGTPVSSGEAGTTTERKRKMGTGKNYPRKQNRS